nr:unnamed protein product [Callosobruchus analis]
MVININEEKDPKMVMKEIKKSLNKENVHENVKRVIPLQKGGILMECYSAEQQQRMKGVLEKNNFNLKEKKNTDPMLMFTGIERGFSPEEFITELLEQNPDIKLTFGENVSSKIRFVAKRPCRNDRKENIVLQLHPDIFKWIIKRDNISFDLTKIYVQEYYNIAMCYKCCNYGHVAHPHIVATNVGMSMKEKSAPKRKS